MKLEEVAQAMAAHYGVTVADIKGPVISGPTSKARVAYYHCARSCTDKSWQQIVRHVNRSCPSTAGKCARLFAAKNGLA